MKIETLLSIRVIIESRMYLTVANEQFLPLLKFIRGKDYYKNVTRYFYKIGETAFSISDENLHEILLNTPILIDTLIFQPFEYRKEDYNEHGDPLGTFEVIVLYKLIAAIKTNEVDSNKGLNRLSLIFKIIEQTEEKIKKVSTDDDDDGEDEIDNREGYSGLMDWKYQQDFYQSEMNDMDETDPTWRIANDLG